MDIRKVFVLGAGTMGHGIAQVCSQTGLSVTLCDVSKDLLDKARAAIGRNLTRAVSKGKMSEEDEAHFCKGSSGQSQSQPTWWSRLSEDIDPRRKSPN
jgi:3-hydroxyacyl-CoA dehydrogenase